ncbi:hypothetical protein WJX72_010694 [[Myrmecia] bisecta]|uniref:Uncharacterized protein n=1 Tax=[Myrmecia] bisecta TaxID=41462 RepID=A0AAW1PY59_9CHLO
MLLPGSCSSPALKFQRQPAFICPAWTRGSAPNHINLTSSLAQVEAGNAALSYAFDAGNPMPQTLSAQGFAQLRVRAAKDHLEALESVCGLATVENGAAAFTALSSYAADFLAASPLALTTLRVEGAPRALYIHVRGRSKYLDGRALRQPPLTEEELAQMRRLLALAAQLTGNVAGSFHFSTGWSWSHDR